MKYPTDCACQGPGWCERHQAEKSRLEFECCRRSPEHFAFQESKEGQGFLQNRLSTTGLEPCRHRGEQTRSVECAGCQGRVQIKVFGCPRHGECALVRSIPNVACCAMCPDFEPEHH